jgi:hypothetical protein
MLNIKNILLAILILTFPSISKSDVFVSPVMSIDSIINNYIVQAGRFQIVPLPGTGSQVDSYSITIYSTNATFKDITAYVVDQSNLNLYLAGSRFNGIGFQRAINPSITGSTGTTGQKFLILDNRYAAVISKKLNISIQGRFPMPAADQERIKETFSRLYSNLKRNLDFPDFNIYVEPCGQVNAFSESFGTGDIHYCTETISHLSKTNNEGAFTAIFLHEVGHSLLGLWGIPGNNNEDIADEFSTYSLMSSGPSGYALLNQWIEFWKNRDSMSEAKMIISNGDRHSLSIQRIRNIKENMQSGEAFIKRWNQLIYQHATNDALNKILKNPSYGDDIELAERILDQRKLSVEVNDKKLQVD